MNLACCVHELGGLILLNVNTTLLLLFFVVIAMRILMMPFFIEIKAAILKFVSNHKRFYNITKAILSKMSKNKKRCTIGFKIFQKLLLLLFSNLNNMVLA